MLKHVCARRFIFRLTNNVTERARKCSPKAAAAQHRNANTNAVRFTTGLQHTDVRMNLETGSYCPTSPSLYIYLIADL